MINFLISTHSGIRWLVLLFITWATINALMKRKSTTYAERDRRLNLLAMTFFHLQAVIGISIYFFSPKVQFFEGWIKQTMYRFYGLEHALLMVIVFVLLTVGHSKSKKADTPTKKHRVISLFYTIALCLIFIAIPWPFRTSLGSSWF